MGKNLNEVRNAQKARRNKIILWILVVAAIVMVFANIRLTGQVTSGGIAGMQVGRFDKFSQANTDFYCMTSLYANKDRKGMHAFLFSNFQVPPSSQPPWAYFATGCGWGFKIKPRKEKDSLYTSSIAFGFGVGFQTTNQQSTMLREMGYVIGEFPIKIKRNHYKDGYSNHPIIVFASFDIANKNSYRYKTFAVFQFTDTPDHINILGGVHYERYVGLGPTLQIHIGPKRKAQLAFAATYSFELQYVSGVIGFFGKW